MAFSNSRIINSEKIEKKKLMTLNNLINFALTTAVMYYLFNAFASTSPQNGPKKRDEKDIGTDEKSGRMDRLFNMLG